MSFAQDNFFIPEKEKIMYYANQWKWCMNDSHACLTTHVDLADTNRLYRDQNKMETKNYSFGQDNKKVLDLFYSADIIGDYTNI